MRPSAGCLVEDMHDERRTSNDDQDYSTVPQSGLHMHALHLIILSLECIGE